MADTRRRLIANAAVLAVGAIAIRNAPWYGVAFVVAAIAIWWLLTHDLGKPKPKDKK